MRRQDVLFKLETDYKGNAHHISGNAILHALAHKDRIDYAEQRKLRVSHGVFCPAVYGVFPEWHSQSGGRMSFASTLKPVETYADLFLFRRATHPWIHEGRPRDAMNTPAYRRHGDDRLLNPSQAIQTTDGKPRKSQWYIHAYLTATDDSLLPLDESRLDGIQLGGKRNYGYGEVSVKDTQVTDLEELDYSALQESDGHILELVTPYVLTSDYPKVDDKPIPSWWDSQLSYRTRPDVIVDQRDEYELEVVDYGQVTRYEGGRPLETAKNGITRIGSHSKYGYGELWLKPYSFDSE